MKDPGIINGQAQTPRSYNVGLLSESLMRNQSHIRDSQRDQITLGNSTPYQTQFVDRKLWRVQKGRIIAAQLWRLG